MKPFLAYEEDDLKQRRNLIHLGFGRRWFDSNDLQGCFQWNVFLASDRCTEVSDLIHILQFTPLILYFLIIDSSSSLYCSSWISSVETWIVFQEANAL
jgi:hypothetical protein